MNLRLALEFDKGCKRVINIYQCVFYTHPTLLPPPFPPPAACRKAAPGIGGDIKVIN